MSYKIAPEIIHNSYLVWLLLQFFYDINVHQRQIRKIKRCSLLPCRNLQLWLHGAYSFLMTSFISEKFDLLAPKATMNGASILLQTLYNVFLNCNDTLAITWQMILCTYIEALTLAIKSPQKYAIVMSFCSPSFIELSHNCSCIPCIIVMSTSTIERCMVITRVFLCNIDQTILYFVQLSHFYRTLEYTLLHYHLSLSHYSQ